MIHHWLGFVPDPSAMTATSCSIRRIVAISTVSFSRYRRFQTRLAAERLQRINVRPFRLHLKAPTVSTNGLMYPVIRLTNSGTVYWPFAWSSNVRNSPEFGYSLESAVSKQSGCHENLGIAVEYALIDDYAGRSFRRKHEVALNQRPSKTGIQAIMSQIFRLYQGYVRTTDAAFRQAYLHRKRALRRTFDAFLQAN